MSVAWTMPYRTPDPDRTLESAREAAAVRAAHTQARVRWIAREISRLDEGIGYWSARYADGAPVPPHVWALVTQKQRFEIELRRRSWQRCWAGFWWVSRSLPPPRSF